MTPTPNKRTSRRYQVEGIYGNLLYTSDLEVLNISVDGAAIETAKRLELNRDYVFRVKYRNTFIKLKGRVVWAILVSRQRTDSRPAVPVYRAGIRFSETFSEKANLLYDFIEENRIKSIENRLGGVRFKIAGSGNIKVDVPHRYRVNRINLSGMLVETEYPLKPDSHFAIELFVNHKLMNIEGRVANCRRQSNGTRPKFRIGIEFVKISDDDREFLEEFMRTLEDS